MLEGYQAFREAWRTGWAPPPDLSTAVWAEQFRYVPAGTSPWWGPWRNSRFPFLVGIMDALDSPDPRHERVVVKKGIQMGATECLINWKMRSWDLNPGPGVWVLPNIQFTTRYVTKRIEPAIEGSPALRGKVAGTSFLKLFEGGSELFTWASSPAAAASDPMRDFTGDEVDRWVVEFEEEGDVLDVFEGRTTQYANRKMAFASSPTIRNRSRIEKVFNQSDQQRLYVPCPECGHMDFITWQGYGDFVAKKDPGHFWIEYNEKLPERDIPQSARMVCPACKARVPEERKPEMLAHHEWRPTLGAEGRPVGDGHTIGFHLPSLYAPPGPMSWARLVREFRERKGDPARLHGWINLRLGETYEENAGQARKDVLLARRHVYKAEVPDGVGAVVAAVDVQDAPARLVYQVEGFGLGEENWKIEHDELIGDVGGPKVWRELDKIRDRGWRHESGRLLRIQAMLVDCKFRTDDVLSYCKSRAGRWVFAARGTGEKGRELVLGHNAKNAYLARVYNLCSDSGRETVFDRLLIDSAGPGFIHIPMPDKEGGRWAWSNEEFIEQLLAEVPKYKWTRRWGRTRFWDPVRDRNEAWDLSVFCLAALRIRPHLIRDMAELVAKWREPLKEGEDPGGELAEDEPTPPPASPRGRWMRGWRG